MNEILFIAQSFLIVLFALGALRLGSAALVSWVAVQALIANLFVLKQITLFGFDVTASDGFAIGSLLGLNLLQEYYSKEEALKASWICFFFMVFFTIVSQVHLFYVPSVYDTAHSSFAAILSHSPRLLMASMGVFFVVQQFDARFFFFLKRVLPRTGFAVRSAIALIISQLFDTTLFSFAGLYGLVASVVDVIVVSFIVKLVVIFTSSSVIKMARS